jgi:hypothetical protein
MPCADALRAHLLGDAASPDERRAAAVHLARCPSCAGVIDDLDHDETGGADDVLGALAAHRPAPRPWIRAALAVLASGQLFLALAWLVGITPLLSSEVQPEHLTRDGSLGLFIGAAGLLAAVRPRYAIPAVIVVALGVFIQVVAGALDESHEHVSAGFELLHLLTLAILGLTAAIAGSRAAEPTPPARPSGLRAVTDDASPGTAGHR